MKSLRLPAAVLAAAALAAALLVARGHFRSRVEEPERAPEPGAPADAGPLGLRGPEPPVPGSEVEIALVGRVASFYGERGEDDEADATYRALVAAIGRDDVLYDRALSRAAREAAVQAALWGGSLPDSVMAFVLRSAGAPESTAALYRLSTSSEESVALREAIAGALASPPPGQGKIAVGVGEAATPGERFVRRITVLSVRRPYSIAPAPRRAELASTWHLEVDLPPGFGSPIASVLYPDGEIRELQPDVAGRRVLVAVPTGDRPGTMEVAIDGIGAGGGPEKLLQIGVEIGRDPPRRFRYVVPDPEDFDGAEAAEAYALALLTADRVRFGLAPLVPDPALAAVARAHSEEMRDLRYFAHLSPRTGLVGDRLAAAGYRTTTHAENLARNDSIYEAEEALLASVGHRRNILGVDFTHVGVGVAVGEESGRTIFHLTQVFARKVTPLLADDGELWVLEAVNAARAERGARALGIDEALGEVARRGAERAAGGAIDRLPEQVGEEARPLLAGRASVTVQVVYDLGSYEPPEPILDPAFAWIGVGVVQSPEDLAGRTGVVLVVAEDP